jgi:hypothetical protein
MSKIPTETEMLSLFIERARQAVLAAADGRQKLVRHFVLALAEAELARMQNKQNTGKTPEFCGFDNGICIIIDVDAEIAMG